MSGPKGISYRVVSAAELRRREQAQARAVVQAAELRWNSVEGDWRSARELHGARVAALPSKPREAGRSAAALLSYATSLDQTCVAAEASLRGLVAQAQTSALMASLQQMVDEVRLRPQAPSAMLPNQAPAAKRPNPVNHSEAVIDAQQQALLKAARSEAVGSVIRGCDPELSTATRDGIEKLAAEVMLAAPSTWQGVAAKLRFAVEHANTAAQAKRADTHRLRAMDAQLASLPEALAGDVRADIAQQIQHGSFDLERTAARVAQVLDDDRRERDRQFTADAIRNVLANLDYEPESEFATLLVQDGVAYVSGAGWTQHAVRVRLPKDGVSATFNVVRDSLHSSAADDLYAEQSWCESFDKLGSALSEQGVGTTVIRRIGAGELPLPTVAAERLNLGHKSSGRQSKRTHRA